jgi:PKD repeat protein
LTWAASTDATSGVSGYSVLVDGSQIAGSTAGCQSGSCSVLASTALSDGAHTWQVVATDKAGNNAASALGSFDVAVSPSASVEAVGTLETNRPVTFSASGSSDSNSTLSDYAWDFDGSGSYSDERGSSPSVIHSFTSAGTYHVELRVRDAAGLTAVASELVDVVPTPPPGYVGVSIDAGNYATDSLNVTLNLVWPVGATTALISSDGGFLAGQTKTFSLADSVTWTMKNATSERLPQTVYVRYLGAGIDLTTFTDDIVVDTTVPTISSAVLVGSSGVSPGLGSHLRADANKPRRIKYSVALHAAESKSGIAEAQFSNRRTGGTSVSLKSKRLKGYVALSKTVVVNSAVAVRFVRVQSAAGKWSGWKAIS